MKNPVIMIVALCSSVIFPPLFLLTVPLLIVAVRGEQHRLQSEMDRNHAEARAKARAKAIRQFASS